MALILKAKLPKGVVWPFFLMEIGIYLAELGDPRPGVGLRPDGLPDVAWCKVPGGKITLEGKAGTFRVDPF